MEKSHLESEWMKFYIQASFAPGSAYLSWNLCTYSKSRVNMLQYLRSIRIMGQSRIAFTCYPPLSTKH